VDKTNILASGLRAMWTEDDGLDEEEQDGGGDGGGGGSDDGANGVTVMKKTKMDRAAGR
jgi:hypothetical protein